MTLLLVEIDGLADPQCVLMFVALALKAPAARPTGPTSSRPTWTTLLKVILADAQSAFGIRVGVWLRGGAWQFGVSLVRVFVAFAISSVAMVILTAYSCLQLATGLCQAGT